MTHKHTPGPWQVHIPGKEFRTLDHPGVKGGDTGIEILAKLFNHDGTCGGYQVVIGHVNCHPWIRILSKEDATLIAAAPDMLAALEEVTNNVFWDSDKDQAVYQMDGKTMKMVRDAIHKATGKDA